MAAQHDLAAASPSVSAFAQFNVSTLAGRRLRSTFAGLESMVFSDIEVAIEWLHAQATLLPW